MAKKRVSKKDDGKVSVDTSYSRIIPSGDGKYVRIMLAGKSKLVKVGSQEYLDELSKLSDLVGGEKINIWLKNLGL